MSLSSSNNNSDDLPTEVEQAAAQKLVRDLSLELSTIKNAIQKLGSSNDSNTSSDDVGNKNDDENTFKITALKVRNKKNHKEINWNDTYKKILNDVFFSKSDYWIT